ncbi:MAG: sulfite exporter TauE/SafE family protein [Paracoccaceae bacterium]
MEALADILGLSPGDALQVALIVFFAGLVRGFAGFALSALVMSGAAMILAPVELLPICWFLELAASILMTRGGARAGETRVAISLVTMGAVGIPVGLYLTTSLPVEASRLMALSVILALAALQMWRLRLPWLATRAGLLSTGVVAGIVTGLAGVGGMVVALYVLARDAPAAAMRGTMVLFLVFGSITSLVMLVLFGLMTELSVIRGLALGAPTMLGVFIGARFFTARLAHLYRPFCLALLIGLALLGMARAL